MRGFLVFILFAVVSAQVEGAMCVHLDENESTKTSTYAKATEDHSENSVNDLSMDGICLFCGHAHVVLFKHVSAPFKFINIDQKLVGFQNAFIESRSVQPPIDPPRAQLA